MLWAYFKTAVFIPLLCPKYQGIDLHLENLVGYLEVKLMKMLRVH